MRYNKLKSIDGSDSVTKYYKLDTDEEALANVFYGVKDGVAERIEGTASGYDIIGFSHGGDKVVKGKILLDINPQIAYIVKLGENESRPEVGEVVNGYQRVIAVNYENDPEWLDNPYYVCTIVQPDGSAFATEIDDSDAGEGGNTP